MKNIMKFMIKKSIFRIGTIWKEMIADRKIVMIKCRCFAYSFDKNPYFSSVLVIK